MVRSMTAFSRAESSNDDVVVRIEIRAYNSRHLDIALHMPHQYLCFEEKIKNLIGAKIARGRISIHIEIKKELEAVSKLTIDESKITAYYHVLNKLKESFHLNDDISLDHLLKAEDFIKTEETDIDMEACFQVIQACLEQALDDLNAMRDREGNLLLTDLRQRLDFLKKANDQIKDASSDLLSHYQERLKKRISILTAGIVDIDAERIAQEAALLADRSDISEEIVRVASHIEQFQAIMDSEESSGRKLNFLLQEFNREFNTMGSKTSNTDVSYLVVDAKAEIEKMREQVQNIE